MQLSLFDNELNNEEKSQIEFNSTSLLKGEHDQGEDFYGSILYKESLNKTQEDNKFNISLLNRSAFGIGLIKSNEIENIESNFKLDFKKLNSKIIQSSENIHYLCPKCHTFPIILIDNSDIIIYICEYKNSKNGIRLSIEKNLDENFLSFLNENYKNYDFEKYTKCNGEMHKGERYPFVCYCLDYKLNLCEECLVIHKNEEHNLYVFCLYNSETRKAIQKIIEIINHENKYINLDLY